MTQFESYVSAIIWISDLNMRNLSKRIAVDFNLSIIRAKKLCSWVKWLAYLILFYALCNFTIWVIKKISNLFLG